MTTPSNRAPRVTVDCPHGDRHPHGQRNAYVLDKCRCEPCTTAAREYEQKRRRDRLYGITAGLVDAQPVRDHLAMLSDAGIGYKHAADLAKVSRTIVQTILYHHPSRPDAGPAKRVKADTAARILAVQPDLDALSGGAATDSRGTARRLRALVARGWSQARLTTRLDVSMSTVQGILAGRPATADTVRRIRDAYEDLWDQAPPTSCHRERIAAARARNYAAARRWAPPAAWDDIDHDTTPQPHTTTARRIPVCDRLDDVDFLLSTGASLADAARRCGWSNVENLNVAAHRAGRPTYSNAIEAAA